MNVAECATGDPSCDSATALLQILDLTPLPPNYLFVEYGGTLKSFSISGGGGLDPAPRGEFIHSTSAFSLSSDPLRNRLHVLDGGQALPNYFVLDVNGAGAVSPAAGFPLEITLGTVEMGTVDRQSGLGYVEFNNTGGGNEIVAYEGASARGLTSLGVGVVPTNMEVDPTQKGLYISSGSLLYRFQIVDDAGNLDSVNFASVSTPLTSPAIKDFVVQPSGRFVVAATDTFFFTDNLFLFPWDANRGAFGTPVSYTLNSSLLLSVLDVEFSPAGDSLYVLASTEGGEAVIFIYSVDSVSQSLTLLGESSPFPFTETYTSLQVDGITGSLYMVGYYVDSSQNIYSTIRGFAVSGGTLYEAGASPYTEYVMMSPGMAETLY